MVSKGVESEGERGGGEMSDIMNTFQEMLQRITELGNSPLPTLRIFADDDTRPGSWLRGKCIAEIIDMEFRDKLEEYKLEE